MVAVIAILMALLVACAEPATPPRPASPAPSPPPLVSPITPDRVEVLAPVDALSVAVAESFPPQYFAQLTVGLPNGCAQYSRYELAREGRLLRITVWNTEPAPHVDMACTMIYGLHELNVPLGSDFEAGASYTVEANGVREQVVAQ